MITDYDEIPVRLPSGKKALVRLPRPFTPEDARHLGEFLALYIEGWAVQQGKENGKV